MHWQPISSVACSRSRKASIDIACNYYSPLRC